MKIFLVVSISMVVVAVAACALFQGIRSGSAQTFWRSYTRVVSQMTRTTIAYNEDLLARTAKAVGGEMRILAEGFRVAACRICGCDGKCPDMK